MRAISKKERENATHGVLMKSSRDISDPRLLNVPLSIVFRQLLEKLQSGDENSVHKKPLWCCMYSVVSFVALESIPEGIDVIEFDVKYVRSWSRRKEVSAGLGKSLGILLSENRNWPMRPMGAT